MALQTRVKGAWAASTSQTYRSAWNDFTRWCAARRPPLSALPASELTIALYLESRTESAKSFAVIKTASAAIAQMHSINLHPAEPTKGALASMIRKAAARDLGLAPHNLKSPWTWAQVRDFTATYCTPTGAEFTFITALAAATLFVCACRFDDAHALRWANLDASRPGFLVITFAKRKEDQFRKGSSVTIPDDPLLEPNLPAVFRRWKLILRPESESALVFPSFSLAMAKQGISSLQLTTPLNYDVFSNALALWMGELMGLSPEEFKHRFGTRSGRAGGTTAALAAGVPEPLIRKHGDWRSAAMYRYMEPDAITEATVARAIATNPASQNRTDSAPLPH